MGYFYGGEYISSPILKICSKCGSRNIKQWDACTNCGHYDNPYDKK